MKMKKRISKFLSVFLSLAFVLTMIPSSAFTVNAAEGDSNNSGVVVDKTATLEDDGTYTINLSAYATGTTTTVTEKSGTPLDIVLVLDQSGSMYSSNYLRPLKNAVTNFVNTISTNAKEYNVNHRIALVGFASNNNDGKSSNGTISSGSSSSYWINTGLFVDGKLKNYGKSSKNTNTQLTASDYQKALVSVNTNNTVTSSITTAIENIAASGGTRTSYGIEMANQVFNNNSIEEGRQRIVVVFTDGEPGQSGYDTTEANSAVNKAYTTKNTYGSKVYTIGLYSSTTSSNVTNFMNYLSSNYPAAKGTSNNGNSSHGDKTDSKYYATTANSSELNNIFSNISEDIQHPSTTVTLNGDSVMRDVIGDGFKLPKDYNVEDNVTIKTVAGSQASKDAAIAWGTETSSPAGISASVDGQNVNITGFNYSKKYIAPSHGGEKLVVTIKGVEATDAAVKDAEVDTNAETSGIYATSDAESCIPFQQPKTILTSKSYVLDYAKEVTLNSSDWKQNTLTKISGDMAKSAADVSAKYGDITKTGNTVKYQPKTTNWNGYDSFYAFGTTSDTTVKAASANANGNLWSKVNVIPANNVYYEDDFVTNDSAGTVGIKYTGTWNEDGVKKNNKETANGDVHGWETSLANDTGYSDGSAHKLEAGATATFTFTGEGVDIYSRTDMTTGTVTANLYEGTEAKKAKIKKALVVDNKSVSGDQYYQIPTLSFEKLGYGTYTVKITVTNQAEGRSTYYLDGIRVYNPVNPVQEDETVSAAYGADEIKATFDKARDLLENGKVAFIDEGKDEEGNPTGESTVGDYANSEIGKIAPKNEIYLAKDQSIVLKVENNADNKYYLGLKAPQGSTTVEFTNGSGTTAQVIAHTTDLYYKVTPNGNGEIVVTNTGEKLLSITKLRTAGSGIGGASFISDGEALDALTTFKAAKSSSYQSKPETDEALAEQENTVVTETEKNEAIETGDVVIKDSEESKETTTSSNNSSIKNLFNSIKSFFGNR